jgi:hypothetical protein
MPAPVWTCTGCRWEPAAGTIPDAATAVDSPRRRSTDQVMAGQVLDLVPCCPLLTWGRDESRTGEMWNSNSLTAWSLARSGHPPTPSSHHRVVGHPEGCRVDRRRPRRNGGPRWRQRLATDGASRGLIA